MFTSDEAYEAIGKVIRNIHALEFALRLFLYEIQKNDSNLHNQSFDMHSLSVGDCIPETALTSYDTLGQLIKKFNAELRNRRFLDQVDSGVVGLRDAIAHGRVFSLQPEGPFSILKFSRPVNRQVVVEVAVEINQAWVKQQVEHTLAELYKVIRLARDLGLTCFPE